MIVLDNDTSRLLVTSKNTPDQIVSFDFSYQPLKKLQFLSICIQISKMLRRKRAFDDNGK